MSARPEDILILTGAGMSAESGVPTFRGSGGLWNGVRAEDVATPEAFRRDPGLVWEFYLHRRRQLRSILPHAGHRAITDAQAKLGPFPVITQNVDGLHQLAGNSAVHEIHGSIRRSRCFGCGAEDDDSRDESSGELPRCSCGGMLRPAVVWFGEALPRNEIDFAFEAAARARTVLVVGTSSLVHPAAMIPRLALERGAEVIEINPEPTTLSADATRFVRGGASEFLPRELERFF